MKKLPDEQSDGQRDGPLEEQSEETSEDQDDQAQDAQVSVQQGVLGGQPDMYRYELKIPKDRVAVLIGTDGLAKKDLEESSSAKIQVDSKEGDIVIEGKDPLMLYALREVIKAISRGFSPETAKLLLKQDYMLEVISLSEYSRQKNHQLRLKGRVIGADGKSRRTIEELTGCFISVYGKTISLIGPIEYVSVGKRAVLNLLDGATHASTFKWLERQRKEMLRFSRDERQGHVR